MGKNEFVQFNFHGATTFGLWKKFRGATRLLMKPRPCLLRREESMWAIDMHN